MGDTGDDRTPALTLARAFHEDGFVALVVETHAMSQSQVAAVKSAILERYEQYMAVAKANAIDLSLAANSERIPGFYVRQGGRIDMELLSVIAKDGSALPGSRNLGKDLVSDVKPVDADLLRGLESHWKQVTDAIFAAPEGSEAKGFSSEYVLEYIGCVVARPGDGDQNWHLDGVHRNLIKHEPADRLNVFVPLVDITPEMGGTEMKKRSQFHDEGRRGVSFEGYGDLESVTHYVTAGTPLVMDYRVWHRGVANGSSTVLRPLLYFKYAREMPDSRSSKRYVDGKNDEASSAAKKKKRVALVTVVTR